MKFTAFPYQPLKDFNSNNVEDDHDLALQQLPSFGTQIREFVCNVVAASSGGAANVLIGQPLDTAKGKMQIFPSMYKGTMHCLKETKRVEGLAGVYSGLSPNLAVVVVEAAVLFVVYPQLQLQYAYYMNIDELTPLEKGCMGSLASIASATFMTPLEVVKCRLQVMRENLSLAQKKWLEEGHPSPRKIDANPPISKVAFHIYKNEGPMAFLKGIQMALPRDVLGGFVYIYVYEQLLKVFCPPCKRDGGIPLWDIFTAGGIAGSCMWLTSYHFDVVKARLQNDTTRGLTAISVAKKMWVKEGWRSFFSGLRPVVIRAFPGSGMFFIVYETMRRNLRLNLINDEDYETKSPTPSLPTTLPETTASPTPSSLTTSLNSLPKTSSPTKEGESKVILKDVALSETKAPHLDTAVAALDKAPHLDTGMAAPDKASRTVAATTATTQTGAATPTGPSPSASFRRRHQEAVKTHQTQCVATDDR